MIQVIRLVRTVRQRRANLSRLTAKPQTHLWARAVPQVDLVCKMSHLAGAHRTGCSFRKGSLDRLYNSTENLAPFEPPGGVQAGDLFLPLASNILPGSELARVARQAQEFRLLGLASGSVAPNRPPGSRATTSATLTYGGGLHFPLGGWTLGRGLPRYRYSGCRSREVTPLCRLVQKLDGTVGYRRQWGSPTAYGRQ